MRGLGALCGALLLTGSAPAERGTSLFTGADPAALVIGERVWLYPTGSGSTLRGWSSADLRSWHHGPVLIRLRDVTWIEPHAARQLWAPHMTAANGRYYLYYSVGPQEPLPSRIGVAACDTPSGPCRDSGQALVDGSDAAAITAHPSACADGMRPTGSGRFHFEAIDPMVFVDPVSGRRLLYAGGSNGSVLRLWELAPDMEHRARELLIDQPPCFTEGVWMHERNGVYYLSYSSGHWNRSDYSVRYSTAPTPTGPWTYRGIILRANDRFQGPGHHSFFKDPHTGQWWIAYHRWEYERTQGPYRDQRHVAIAPVRYQADGAIVPIEPR